MGDLPDMLCVAHWIHDHQYQEHCSHGAPPVCSTHQAIHIRQHDGVVYNHMKLNSYPWWGVAGVHVVADLKLQLYLLVEMLPKFFFLFQVVPNSQRKPKIIFTLQVNINNNTVLQESFVLNLILYSECSTKWKYPICCKNLAQKINFNFVLPRSKRLNCVYSAETAWVANY